MKRKTFQSVYMHNNVLDALIIFCKSSNHISLFLLFYTSCFIQLELAANWISPKRQDASLFSSGFRRLFAKLLLRNWDEGGVRATERNEFTFFSQLPFRFPRKKLEHILLALHVSFTRYCGNCETIVRRKYNRI